jgi:hypothetical protein
VAENLAESFAPDHLIDQSGRAGQKKADERDGKEISA